MSELRDLLEREAERVTVSPDGLEQVMRRVARRQRTRRLTAAAVAIVLAAGGTLFVVNAFRPAKTTRPAVTPAVDTTGTYRISGIDVGPARDPDGKVLPDMAQISFDYAWTSDTYPGAHRCTWVAFDADGAVVGRQTGDFLAMMPEHRSHTNIDVSAPPVTAQASCDPERLDIGDPYAYEITNVRIVPGVTHMGSPFGVAYDMEWLGKGQPGMVGCTLTVREPSGTIVAQRYFETDGADAGERDATGFAAREMAREVSLAELPSLSASLECGPYTRPYKFTPSFEPAPPAPDLGVSVAVFNGTNRIGLASMTAHELMRNGYIVAQPPANAPAKALETTTVYYRTPADRRAAEQLAASFFPDALIEALPASVEDVNRNVDIAIFLGKDFAGPG